MGTPPQGPPNQSSKPSQWSRPLKDVIADIATATEAQVKFTEAQNKGVESVELIAKRTRSWATELKSALAVADDMEDTMKALVEYQKNMSKTTLNATNYEDARKSLEEMERVMKDAMKNGFLSKSNRAQVKQTLDIIGKGLTDIKGKVGAIGNDPALDKVHLDLGKVRAQVEKTTKAMKGMKLSGLTKDAAHLEKAFSHLFGKGGNSKIDKFHQFGQFARQLKYQRQQVAGNRKALKEQIKDAKAAGTIMDPDFKGSGNRTARDAGFGPMGAAYHARKMAGQKFNPFSYIGAKTEQAGQAVTGGAAAGAESLASLAGTFAGPLAMVAGIAAILYETVEKDHKYNTDIHEQLGKGGLYGGDARPDDVFGSVKDNLRLHSLWGTNMLGVGYDKNLELAKAMTEGGFGTSNLANHDVKQDSKGMLDNSFGTMQRNAYVYGKMAGLSPNETMTQTIKLISQYKQSLGSTEDFFVQITKDTHAAGISTNKYIELIDEVNSHYDRSNKLLMTTVTIMRMLGSTGTQSAEDMKESLETLTNHGKQMALPQAAYLYTTALQTEHGRSQIVSAAEAGQDDAIETAARGMLGPNPSERELADKKDYLKKGVENSTDGGVKFITDLDTANSNAFRDKTDRSKGQDAGASQSQHGALQNVLTRRTALLAARGAVEDTMHGEGAGNAGLGMAIRDENVGVTPVTTTMQAFWALNKALEGSHDKAGNQYHLNDFMDLKKRAEMEKSGFTQQMLSSQFGIEKGWIPNVERLIPQMGQIEAQKFAEGTGGLSKEQATKQQAFAQKKYEQLKAAHYDFEGMDTGKGSETIEKLAKNGPGSQNRLANALSRLPGVEDDMTDSGVGSLQELFKKVTTDLDRDKVEKDAENQTLNTANLAQTLEAVFKQYFLAFDKLVVLIEKIAWSKYFGGPPAGAWRPDAEEKKKPNLDPNLTYKPEDSDTAFKGANSLLDSMNIDDPTKEHPEIRLSADQEKSIDAKLQGLRKLHKVKVSDPIVDVTTGNVFQTVTYLNVDATQHAHAAPSTPRHTGEVASKKPGKPGKAKPSPYRGEHDAGNSLSGDDLTQGFHGYRQPGKGR